MFLFHNLFRCATPVFAVIFCSFRVSFQLFNTEHSRLQILGQGRSRRGKVGGRFKVSARGPSRERTASVPAGVRRRLSKRASNAGQPVQAEIWRIYCISQEVEPQSAGATSSTSRRRMDHHGSTRQPSMETVFDTRRREAHCELPSNVSLHAHAIQPRCVQGKLLVRTHTHTRTHHDIIHTHLIITHTLIIHTGPRLRDRACKRTTRKSGGVQLLRSELPRKEPRAGGVKDGQCRDPPSKAGHRRSSRLGVQKATGLHA